MPILTLWYASANDPVVAGRSDSRPASGSGGGCLSGEGWRAIGALDADESLAGVDLGVKVTFGPALTFAPGAGVGMPGGTEPLGMLWVTEPLGLGALCFADGDLGMDLCSVGLGFGGGTLAGFMLCCGTLGAGGFDAIEVDFDGGFG